MRNKGKLESIQRSLTRQQKKNIDSMKGICKAHMPFLLVFILDV